MHIQSIESLAEQLLLGTITEEQIREHYGESAVERAMRYLQEMYYGLVADVYPYLLQSDIPG